MTNSSLDQGYSKLKILLTAVHNLTRVILCVNKHAGSALEKTHMAHLRQLLSNSNSLFPLKPFSRGTFVTHCTRLYWMVYIVKFGRSRSFYIVHILGI